MKRFIILFFTSFTAAITIQAQQLPDTWQPGMALTTWHGAGMRQQSDSLRISDKVSFERHSGMDNNKKYAFTFSQQELNNLLQFLKARHFAAIKTAGPQLVNDGWSSNIILQWNQEIIVIETGAGYTVPEQYRKDLADIEQYITTMAEQKKKHRK